MNGDVTPVAAWVALIGFFLPVFCAFVKRLNMSETTRDMAVFGSCVVAGAGQSFFNGSLAWANGDLKAMLGILVMNVYFVVSGAFVFYKMFWKPSGIDARLSGASGPKMIKG